MKVAIMQPYIFPYIGYFQLINLVDKFIVYDNIKYTKKGWINRNRYLQNGEEKIITIPLKKDSDFLDIRERIISPYFDRSKLLNQLTTAYKKAPYFEKVYPIIERIVINKNQNLFSYIFYSIKEICNYLSITSTIIKSSELNINHTLKSQDRVIMMCKYLNTDVYINPIGGQSLYSKKEFLNNGIQLLFLATHFTSYKQYNYNFKPGLSIIDILMFNNPMEVKEMLNNYELI